MRKVYSTVSKVCIISACQHVSAISVGGARVGPEKRMAPTLYFEVPNTYTTLRVGQGVGCQG